MRVTVLLPGTRTWAHACREPAKLRVERDVLGETPLPVMDIRLEQFYSFLEHRMIWHGQCSRCGQEFQAYE